MKKESTQFNKIKCLELIKRIEIYETSFINE